MHFTMHDKWNIEFLKYTLRSTTGKFWMECLQLVEFQWTNSEPSVLLLTNWIRYMNDIVMIIFMKEIYFIISASM